jgi:fatty-acyl-CoA synthase
VSFSPPFGYALCARRLRPSDTEALDLSAWRVAGVGAEMIHAEWLRQFAIALAPAGFDESAFLPCYGMAECSLAVSFAAVGSGARGDAIDIDRLARHGEAKPVGRGKTFIDCGRPLPGYEVEIRDERGRPVAERRCGRIHLRGPSVMSGYFRNPEASNEVLSADGWLDTGDIGYQVDGALHITGRAKDLMIIKGRNIWPQDLEHLAEQQPEVRPTDASAFSIADDEEGETAVLVVQSRESDPGKLAALAQRLQQAVYAEFAIHCLIELVPPHTLPRTSSGKLSRSTARRDFLERRHVQAAGAARPRIRGGGAVVVAGSSRLCDWPSKEAA